MRPSPHWERGNSREAQFQGPPPVGTLGGGHRANTRSPHRPPGAQRGVKGLGAKRSRTRARGAGPWMAGGGGGRWAREGGSGRAPQQRGARPGPGAGVSRAWAGGPQGLRSVRKRGRGWGQVRGAGGACSRRGGHAHWRAEGPRAHRSPDRELGF